MVAVLLSPKKCGTDSVAWSLTQPGHLEPWTRSFARTEWRCRINAKSRSPCFLYSIVNLPLQHHQKLHTRPSLPSGSFIITPRQIKHPLGSNLTTNGVSLRLQAVTSDQHRIYDRKSSWDMCAFLSSPRTSVYICIYMVIKRCRRPFGHPFNGCVCGPPASGATKPIKAPAPT